MLSHYERMREKEALNDIDSAIYQLRSTSQLSNKYEEIIEILANVRGSMMHVKIPQEGP